MGELLASLASWSRLDTWIAVTASCAGMACALPGCFLLLRRQSMMGDALSHTSLLGVTLGALAAVRLARWGWLPEHSLPWVQHLLILGAAMAVGVVSAALTEGIQKLGGVEASAALGVVFTVLFACGLLLMRLVADESHLDADCVLYGAVETAYVGAGPPATALVCGLMLAINLSLIVIFYKELRLSAFDPAFATSIGVNARVAHYALMTITAATVVAAFEAVGTILVIAMLIVPPATAHLLTDRLWKMIAVSLAVAVLSAWIGHAAAITLPGIVFSRLGYPAVGSASTAGMVAVMSGLLFALAALFGPRYGLVVGWWSQTQLALRIAAEDILGSLYRLQEAPELDTSRSSGLQPEGLATVPSRSSGLRPEGPPVRAPAADLSTRRAAATRLGGAGLIHWLALRWLAICGQVTIAPVGIGLTERGRARAASLVRSHRLWESYLARHFPLPEDHLHDAAERAEHFITPEIREALDQELAAPQEDPHGRTIPDEP